MRYKEPEMDLYWLMLENDVLTASITDCGDIVIDPENPDEPGIDVGGGW